MDIGEAYKVLIQHYTEQELKELYRKEKFDNSGTDTIRKHKYNAELLDKLLCYEKDSTEVTRLMEASKAFKELYEQEEQNR